MSKRRTKCACGRIVTWEASGWSSDTETEIVCRFCGRVYRIEVEETVRADLVPECEATTVTDGFGNYWSSICPTCGRRTIQIVRPGKVQCRDCG